MLVISITIVLGVVLFAIYSSLELTIMAGLMGIVAINEVRYIMGGLKHEVK